MKDSISGFIFFTTLSFIAIISLLLLSGLQHVLMYQKSLAQQEKRQQQFYQLEAVALKLLGQETDLKCVDSGGSVNNSIKRLQKGVACLFKIGNDTYQYLISDLGIKSCWIIKKEGIDYSAKHERISLTRDLKEIIQISLLKPVYLRPCEKNRRVMRDGVVSWRVFNT